MTDTTIGDVNVAINNDTIFLTSRETPENCVILKTDEIKFLIDFLISNVSSECQRRQTFRVPIWNSCEMVVKVTTRESSYRVKALNASVTGIMVDFLDGDPELAIESRVQVTLEFEGNQHTLTGVVKRKSGNRYGLFFPESMIAETVDPAPQLTKIIMALQRRALVVRKHLI